MTKDKPKRSGKLWIALLAVGLAVLLAGGWAAADNRRRMARVRVHMYAGRYPQARKELGRCGWLLAGGKEDLARELDGREIRWHADEARRELGEAKFGKAAQRLRLALRDFPGAAPLTEGLDEVKGSWSREIRRLLDAGKLDRADNELTLALQSFQGQQELEQWRDEVKAEKFLEAGRDADALGQHVEAARHYRDALLCTGDERRKEAIESAWTSLVEERAKVARELAGAGRHEAAIVLYRQANAVSPDPRRFDRQIEAAQSAMVRQAMSAARKSAELVRAAAGVARADAESAKAGAHAAKAWQRAEALRAEAMALGAMETKEICDRARDAWDRAREAYDRSADEARRAVARVSAGEARVLADAARQLARAVEAEKNAPDFWEEAGAHYSLAEAKFKQDQVPTLTAARVAWGKARSVFAMAESVAKAERKHQAARGATQASKEARLAAEVARRDAALAHKSALAIQAVQYARDRWDQAERLTRAAATEFAGGRYADAKHSWLRAKELYIAATGAGGAAVIKQQYERQAQEHAPLLGAHGGQEWKALQAVAAVGEGAFAERNFDKSAREYQGALAALERLLPMARQRQSDRKRELMARAMVVSARDLLGSGNYTEALARADKAIALTPQSAEALALRAEIAEHLVRYAGHTTLAGHQDRVVSVAFAPDGKRFVSTSWDNTAVVWDLSRGAAMLRLRGHTKAVRSAAWSRDGRWIVTGGADETLRLWDAATGKQVRAMTGHFGAINSVAFSPDGTKAVTGSDDKTAKVFDVANGTVLLTCRAHDGNVDAVAWSPDGRFLASGGQDKTVILWSAQTGQKVRGPLAHGAAVTSLAFGPYSAKLLSAGGDQLCLWDAATGQLLRKIADADEVLSSVSFSASGHRAVSCGGLGMPKLLHKHTVKVWDVSRGVLLQALTGPSDFLFSATFSPDGAHVVAVGRDRKVHLWTGK